MRIITGIVFSILILSSCGKDSASNNNQAIDVASQQYVDIVGENLYAVGPGPYSDTVFTTKELALFNSLDTVSLIGTSKPSTCKIALYPNPYSTVALQHQFNSDFSGELIEKIVVADSVLTPSFKLITRIHGPAESIQIAPTIKKGRFRMFITLSAEGNDNFYTYWVNVTSQ